MEKKNYGLHRIGLGESGTDGTSHFPEVIPDGHPHTDEEVATFGHNKAPEDHVLRELEQ